MCMFNRIIFAPAVLNCLLCCSLFGQESLRESFVDKVEYVFVTPELRIRAQTFARENDPIINPIPWVQFVEMTPEGSRVSKGDVVFKLDITGVLNSVDGLENRLEQTKNDVARRISEMKKKVSTLEDERAEKIDAREIQRARLTYLYSLPVEADVKIAEGRVDVAQKNLSANAEELKKSRERLESELISPAMLKADEDRYAEQLAQTHYAEQMLRLAKLKAHPLQIEVVEYRIRNLDLEIQKMDKEIPIQKKILDIEAATQERKVEDLASQLAERKEELSNEFLFAPADGVLIYSAMFKRELTIGGKATKGMELAQIPRRESMALEGVIPEQVRHVFNLGDPAKIRLNIYPDRVFEGKILSISPFSRDAVEGDNPSGVKIVDLVIEWNELPEKLPLGVYGWVTLSTQKPIEGWAVPVSWVRYRGGKAHVSVEGKMEAVNGLISGENFVLSSPHPAHEKIQAEGVWGDAENPEIQLSTDQFMVTGELTPVESEILTTPRVRSWDIQIGALTPENQLVSKGDFLIRLDSQKLRDDLENRQMDLKSKQGERESAEEELEIRRSEQAFQSASSANRIEIRKRERDLVVSGVSTSQILQQQLSLSSAKIQLQKAEAELARSLRNSEWTAAAELKQRKRDVQRRTLQVEKVQIQFDEAKRGANNLEKGTAELELLREIARAAESNANHYRSFSRAQSSLRWRKSREKRALEGLERHEEDIASMEITAPVSGLVKYLKVWDGVRESKIKTGMKVWRGMSLMSLSGAEKLFVEISIPERYIQNIEKGMSVTVRIPSEGGMQWNGELIELQDILEPSEQNTNNQGLYGNQEASQEQILKAKILIDTEEDTVLKPGAIAQIIFPFDK